MDIEHQHVLVFLQLNQSEAINRILEQVEGTGCVLRNDLLFRGGSLLCRITRNVGNVQNSLLRLSKELKWLSVLFHETRT